MIEIALIVGAAMLGFGGILILCMVAPPETFPEDDPEDEDQDGGNTPVGVDRQ